MSIQQDSLIFDLNPDTLVLSDGAAVTSYADPSPGGNDPITISGVTYSAAGQSRYGGLPTVVMSGSGSHFLLPNDFPCDQGMSVYIVADSTAEWHTTTQILLETDSWANPYYGVRYGCYGGSNNYTVVYGAEGNTNQCGRQASVLGIDADTPAIHSVYSTDKSFQQSFAINGRNGVQHPLSSSLRKVGAFGDNVVHQASGSRTPRIGMNASGSAPFTGQIARVLFYDRVLTPAEDLAVLQELSSIYGVALDNEEVGPFSQSQLIRIDPAARTSQLDDFVDVACPVSPQPADPINVIGMQAHARWESGSDVYEVVGHHDQWLAVNLSWRVNGGAWSTQAYNGQGSIEEILMRGDGHDKVSVGVSANGYIHFVSATHNSELNYYVSDQPLTSFTGAVTKRTLDASIADNTSYPSFGNSSPATGGGTLYFHLRDVISSGGGSGDADHAGYVLSVDAADPTWIDWPGTGIEAKIFDGRNSSPDCNIYVSSSTGLVFDETNDRVWFVGRVREEAGGDTNRDVFAFYYDAGAQTWHDSAGSALTLPLTLATIPSIAYSGAVDATLASVSGAIDSSGRMHVIMVQGQQIKHMCETAAGVWSTPAAITTYSEDIGVTRDKIGVPSLMIDGTTVHVVVTERFDSHDYTRIALYSSKDNAPWDRSTLREGPALDFCDVQYSSMGWAADQSVVALTMPSEVSLPTHGFSVDAFGRVLTGGFV